MGSLEVLCRTNSAFDLVFFRCLVRGCGMDAKIDLEEKQQKSFNIKVPDPLSPGVSPGSFMSNEFLCLTLFSSAVSYEAAGNLAFSKNRSTKKFQALFRQVGGLELFGRTTSAFL